MILSSTFGRRVIRGLGTILVMGMVAVGIWYFQVRTMLSANDSHPTGAPTARWKNGLLTITPETADSMKLRAAALEPIAGPTKLRLTGQIMLDPNRLVHVTTRFGGEVVQVGESEAPEDLIRVGQPVEKGKLLAVIWSKEIGEKKSDLVDALSQLYLHEAIYRRLKSPGSADAISQRTIDEMRRNYESDQIEVERCLRTLTSWRITKEQLEVIEREARRIHDRAMQGPVDGESTPVVPSAVPDWAHVEVRSPIRGVVLERNLTVGDIVNTDIDLFKVADLSHLVVMANVYEEDLPSVLALSPEQRAWEVRLTSQPSAEPIRGKIDLIGNVIDPNQHTAVIQGSIQNSEGLLRVGQFVEATIEIPQQMNGFQVPVSAVIDQGSQKHVLVAAAKGLTDWRPVSVRVLRRTSTFAWIQADGEELKQDDQVLVAGGVELTALIQTLAPPPEFGPSPAKPPRN